MTLLFNGAADRKPQTEARRYVCAILFTVLDNELRDPDGWMFGGVDHEPDQRRLRKAIEAVNKEMRRRGGLV